MIGERLRIRAERRDRICVLSLSGSLDVSAGAGLTERIAAERAARPARVVVDMSGVSSVDPGGARALAAAARPLPGQCPVIVRSLRPAARRQLELAGLDLGWLDSGLLGSGRPDSRPDPAEAQARGWERPLADSATGILVREWRYLLGSAEHAAADSYRTAQSLASTEDHLAATLRRLAVRCPAASAHLEGLSQTARSYAATLRVRERHDARAPLPRHTPRAASETIGRAITFIEERAHDEISVADIAAAAYVTVRAVQLAFRRHLATTPLAYLRQVRLERAHGELLSADPDRTTVTAVAAGWHFTNASRFSAYYRTVYGVPPAQTLRQHLAGD